MSCSVFVNGRSRAVIMDDMKTRIDRRDWTAEQHDAIQVGFLPLPQEKQLMTPVHRRCVILPKTGHENPV